MEQRSKSVLMFFPCGGAKSQESFSGVREFAEAENLDFFSAETERAADGSAVLHRSSRAAVSVAGLAGLLHPAGILVWQDALSPAEVRAAAGQDTPVVFVDCGLADAAAPGTRFGRVRCDPASVAEQAARILLPSGYDHFAFVPFPERRFWSEERGDAFARCIELAGKRFHRFDRPAGPSSDALPLWLSALPRPCGVLTANDAVGEEVLGVCAQLGLAVPDDMSVVGVDDYQYLCENTSPTLSSVAMDPRGAARAAVDMLVAMMSGDESAGRLRFVPALGAVQRASTRFARDRRVAQAMEFIRVGACAEGFGPREVVRKMGVSRALADRLFRTVAGHSILEEIHAVRLSHARELLLLGKPGNVVAAACGYSSHDDFRRVFRRRVGMTAWKWARKNRS